MSPSDAELLLRSATDLGYCGVAEMQPHELVVDLIRSLLRTNNRRPYCFDGPDAEEEVCYYMTGCALSIIERSAVIVPALVPAIVVVAVQHPWYDDARRIQACELLREFDPAVAAIACTLMATQARMYDTARIGLRLLKGYDRRLASVVAADLASSHCTDALRADAYELLASLSPTEAQVLRPRLELGAGRKLQQALCKALDCDETLSAKAQPADVLRYVRSMRFMATWNCDEAKEILSSLTDSGCSACLTTSFVLAGLRIHAIDFGIGGACSAHLSTLDEQVAAEFSNMKQR